MKPNIN